MPTKSSTSPTSALRIGVNVRWLISGKLEGTGWYTFRILEQLLHAHPEVEWHLFFDRSPGEDFSFSASGAQVQRHVLGPAARHPWLWEYWNEVRIPSALKKHRIDVYWSPDGLLPKRVRGWHGRLVTTIHDLNFVHQPEGIPARVGAYYRRVVAHSARRADAILTVSQKTKEDVAQTFRLSDAHIAVSYNAPAHAYHPLSEGQKQEARERFAQGQPYFCFVGAFTPRKNVRTLVEAFLAFRQQHPDAPHRLVLAGSSLHRDPALTQALALAGERVLTLGHIPGDALSALYGGAEAFCFPSRFEGFGIPLVEAMASGCPVISSSASCMPEIVGSAGLLVDPEDVPAWAEALGRLAQDPEALQAYRERGLQRAQDFSWTQSASVVWKALQPC